MKMDYCVLGTNNMEASTKFYDSLFEKTELNQVLSTERMTFWQCEDFAFAIARPFNKEPASNGNGFFRVENLTSAGKTTQKMSVCCGRHWGFAVGPKRTLRLNR
jgi:hypothetical protein